jgi:hypothetical protein
MWLMSWFLEFACTVKIGRFTFQLPFTALLLGSDIECLIFGPSFDFESRTQNHMISCLIYLRRLNIFIAGYHLYGFVLSVCTVTELVHFTSQILGRTIDLRSLITQRMNKLFRENIDFLLERFENGDLCGVVVRLFYFYLYTTSCIQIQLYLSKQFTCLFRSTTS